MKNPDSDKPHYKGYIISSLLITVVTAAKVLLSNEVAPDAVFLLYLGVVVCTLRYFGQPAAIFASVLSGIVAIYISAAFTDNAELSLTDLLELLLYWAECAVILLIFRDFSGSWNRTREQLQRFKLLIEKSADGIAIMQLDGSIAYCSPSVLTITGHPAEVFNKAVWWELLMPEELTRVKQQFFQLAGQPGASVKVLHRMKCSDGSFIWVENVITNLLEEPGIRAFIVRFTNVNDRIVHEQQMEDFIGIASHELKTPLTSLKAYTQVLEMRMKKENNTTSAILANKIDRQINRVVSMIFDLLDVTKFQSGTIQLNKSSFDLNDLITEIAETLQASSATHEVVLNLGPRVEIYGDRTRIGQVLTNLVSNGIKYSPDANRVEVTSQNEEGYIRIEVRDYGIGIPQDEINNLFKRFYRVKSVKEAFQGLGLGLFISSQIVSHHGGKMGVSSEHGRGSVFWFTIETKQRA